MIKNYLSYTKQSILVRISIKKEDDQLYWSSATSMPSNAIKIIANMTNEVDVISIAIQPGD